VLVVGAYPPAPGAAARETLETATRLLEEGHDVHVLSPQPSGAGDDAVLVGLRGALALARRSREFDALEVQADPELLIHPETPRLPRILAGLGYAAALRLWRRTTARLGEPADLPGGPGGRVARLIWGSFDRLVVDDEATAHHLRTVIGIPAERIEVSRAQPQPEAPAPEAPLEALPAAGGPGGPGGDLPEDRGDLPAWSVGEAAEAESLMEQVRSRAAVERSRRQADRNSM
jgi:hypothetical protein